MKATGIFAYFVPLFLGLIARIAGSSEADEGSTSQRFKIDGKVLFPKSAHQEWMTNTRVMVDGGEYLGFVR